MLVFHQFGVAVINISDALVGRVVVVFFNTVQQSFTETPKEKWVVAGDIRKKSIPSFHNFRRKLKAFSIVKDVPY